MPSARRALGVADEICLALQRRLDGLIGRLRARRPGAPKRRLLVVQIDGLSRAVLEEALATGRMPGLARLLERGAHRLHPMSVSVPTSTPTFQMAAMYGVRPDIPGFHYYDRRRGADVHFPRREDAAYVEATQACGRRGILRDGSVYGCVFTGGARNGVFSFAQLTRPAGPGLVRMLSAVIVLGWVVVKGLVLTVGEVLRAVARLLGGPRRRERLWTWLKIRVGVSVWAREMFTFAVARDLYDAVPAIYVNYLDYDVAAHAFGPRSRRALRTLRSVDRSLRVLWRVARRVPEHHYDLYVLSDHGQADCVEYQTVTGGLSLAHVLFESLLAGRPGGMTAETSAPISGRRRCRFPPGHRDEVVERDGIRLVVAGPNAFVYFVDASAPLPIEQIERRRPGLAADLSKGPGVGCVLARSAEGGVAFQRGERYRLDDPAAPLYRGRADAHLVRQGFADLLAMPSAGDLVLYGIDAPEGHVSYIPERGAHAGASPEELHTFLVAPRRVPLPERLEHPLQLYTVFLRYQATRRPPTPCHEDDVAVGVDGPAGRSASRVGAMTRAGAA